VTNSSTDVFAYILYILILFMHGQCLPC